MTNWLSPNPFEGNPRGVLRLSEAQKAAFEQQDWDDDGAVSAAWDGGYILQHNNDPVLAEKLWEEINDASNAEDAFADVLRRQDAHQDAKMAAKASRVLGTVAGKMLRQTGSS